MNKDLLLADKMLSEMLRKEYKQGFLDGLNAKQKRILMGDRPHKVLPPKEEA